MRCCVIALALAVTCATSAQDERKLDKRYGFPVNAVFYPQKTPQEAILSLTKAIDNNRVDYLLAQIADPKYVDEKVAEYRDLIPKGGEEAKTILAFERLVKETVAHFLEDPTSLKELRRFGKEGKFEVDENRASGSVKDIVGRRVFLRKIEDRWFFENRQQ